MADKKPAVATHRAYSVIRREGQDDYWLNIGLVFQHKDGDGFNLILQAFPLDGRIVCRRITDDQAGGETQPSSRGRQNGGPPRHGQRRQ